MAEIRRLVERILESDPVIKEGLKRKIINSRALARYILEEDGIDSTQDAVLGIIRRYPLEHEDSTSLRKVFKNCEIAMRTKMADLAVENGPDIMTKIAEFAGSIRTTKGESLRIVVGLQSIRVIADQKALESFRKTFRPNEVIDYSEDLAEISVLLPPEAMSAKGIIAKIATELALNGVNLLGIWCCTPEDIMLVTEDDAARALETLQRLLREEGSTPKRHIETPANLALTN